MLGCCGFHGDVLTVIKNIKARMKVDMTSFVMDFMSSSSLLVP